MGMQLLETPLLWYFTVCGFFKTNYLNFFICWANTKHRFCLLHLLLSSVMRLDRLAG